MGKERQEALGRNVSVAEGAAALGISQVMLRRKLWRGEIGHCKIGRRVLIPMEELETFRKSSMSRDWAPSRGRDAEQQADTVRVSTGVSA